MTQFGWAFGLVVKTLLWPPTSHIRVVGFDSWLWLPVNTRPGGEQVLAAHKGELNWGPMSWSSPKPGVIVDMCIVIQQIKALLHSRLRALPLSLSRNCFLKLFYIRGLSTADVGI